MDIIKHGIRLLVYSMTCKRIDEKKLDICRINVKNENVSYFNLSTNRIMSVYYGGKLYYFRECPAINSKKQYFINAVESFFDTLGHLGISEEHFKEKSPINLEFSYEVICSFKKYMQKKTKDSQFIKRVSKTDLISERCGFSIWKKQVYDVTFFEQFGLDCIPEEMVDIAVYFLWCMRAVAAQYRTLRITQGREYSYFSAVRAFASKIVAESLNLTHMITDIHWCILNISNEKKYFGFISDVAPGSRMKDTVVEQGGALQRELMNLNVLDFISFQVDHGPNNYNIECNSSNCTLCAFDNDNPYTFLPIPIASISSAGVAPLVDKNGIVLRPFFDIDLAERLACLNIKDLKKRLSPYLNFLQINALIYRISKLNQAIIKTKKVRNSFLLNSDEWNDKTVKEELSGKYGATYLSKALKIN